MRRRTFSAALRFDPPRTTGALVHRDRNKRKNIHAYTGPSCKTWDFGVYGSGDATAGFEPEEAAPTKRTGRDRVGVRMNASGRIGVDAVAILSVIA